MICPHCGKDMEISSVEQAIERYYRSRAAGSRITLRKIAQKTGISYSTLTKYKMRYDAAGKWGSKKVIP